MTTQEKNELLAVFHGWTYHKTGLGTGKKWWDFPEWGKSWWTSDSFKYHKSHDWLIPVWYKFRELWNNSISESMETMIIDRYWDHRELIIAGFSSGEFSHLYDALVNAVQWYNSIKKEA